MRYLTLLTLSVFGGATLGTALIRRLAVRYGWMVLPRADRWHKQPTARYGGIGFYPVFLLGAVSMVAPHLTVVTNTSA